MNTPQPPAEEPSEADLELASKIADEFDATVYRPYPNGPVCGYVGRHDHATPEIAVLLAAYRAKCVAEATQQLRDQLGALQSSLGACEHVRLSEALSGRDALIVQMGKVLREIQRHLDHDEFVAIGQTITAALTLVPESLADCVVVKQSDYQKARDHFDVNVALQQIDQLFK